MNRIIVIVLALGLSCTPKGAAEPPSQPGDGAAAAAPAETVLGDVRFETSCDPGVRDELNQALAYLHHMMYSQAEQRFASVARSDANCAMAHWGVAMSLFHPLWPDTPSEAELARGQRALERAKALGPKTARESAYIAAAQAYYADWQKAGEGERLQRFEQAMQQVHRRYPRDLDAAALYALSMLATAPAGDKTLSQQRRAAAILRGVHQAEPRHPGAVHYGIHAHDFPGLADKGRELADAYSGIAPGVPHALHMPSHIYVRLGDWQPNIEWNRRSAQAALEYPEHGTTSMHYVHALDYMMYGYLQQLQDERARQVMDDIRTHGPYHDHPGTAYGIAAIYARYPLERRDWKSAAKLAVAALPPGGFDWSGRPEGVAVLAYASGLGAARSGDVGAAEAARADLERLARTLDAAGKKSPGFLYWAQRARVQRDAVDAWILHARGSDEQALEAMRRAADLEDEIGKNPVMPGFVLPARELLGDLLLELDKPGEALEAYQKSLANAPRRANSLYGAARAAERLGQTDNARRYYRELVDLAAEDAAERPILIEARRYLGRSAR